MAEPHLEGLLHLATLSFAMTLAYLGLDKVGDDARARLDKDIERKAQEITKAPLAREDAIQHNGEVNRLHAIVGDVGDRKAICMLLAVAKGIPHDLYQVCLV